MIERVTPDGIVVVVAVFKYFYAGLEELSISKFIQQRSLAEHFHIEYVLIFEVLIHLLIATSFKYILQCLTFDYGLLLEYSDRWGFGWFWEDSAIFACIGGIDTEGASWGEVELAIKGGCAVGWQCYVFYLCFVMVFEGNGAFRDVYEYLDVKIRTWNVADDSLQHIGFQYHKLLNCFLVTVTLLINGVSISLIKKSLSDD